MSPFPSDPCLFRRRRKDARPAELLEAALTLFGARLVVSTALAAAQAIVMDSSAAVAIEHSSSPVALVDTHAVQNASDVVLEVVGGALVTTPGSVIVVKAA